MNRPASKFRSAPPFEATVTAPDSMGARGEREASYFAAALWGPTRKCPENLIRSARRAAPTMLDTSFSSRTPFPRKRSFVERLQFERGGEVAS